MLISYEAKVRILLVGKNPRTIKIRTSGSLPAFSHYMCGDIPLKPMKADIGFLLCSNLVVRTGFEPVIERVRYLAA
jgi:hypothetical protein